MSVSSVSFNIVKSSLVDNLLEVKLTFFYSLASELELFLTIFQSEAPFASFCMIHWKTFYCPGRKKSVTSEVQQSFKEKLNVSRLELDQQDNLLTANNTRQESPLTENLHEQSLIAQRQVYDYVHHCGGVEHVDITKSMLQYEGRKKSRLQEKIKELQKKEARVLEVMRKCYRCK
ncbi:hypothetical protein PR048_021775, partial [Dryococelus australis]